MSEFCSSDPPCAQQKSQQFLKAHRLGAMHPTVLVLQPQDWLGEIMTHRGSKIPKLLPASYCCQICVKVISQHILPGSYIPSTKESSRCNLAILVEYKILNLKN